MPVPPLRQDENFQACFHRRWNQLNDPHVRALAWLLDSPDLLIPTAARWHGKIASLGPEAADQATNWLGALDSHPAELHAYLAMQPFTRLGRYAEKLLAYYFTHRGTLVANGLQVRQGKSDTVGEFDFLLRENDQLVHWEFATKFYLLESSGAGHEADYFIGPGLADTLGTKMHKILDRQLALAQHPAARDLLPQPVASAQALLKGWLFYHDNDPMSAHAIDVSENHCRGFWRTMAEMNRTAAECYAILPRLSWLAPAKLNIDQVLDRTTLHDLLEAHFLHDSMPELVALLSIQGGYAVEVDRGFVVPNDWRQRAGARIRTLGGGN